MKKLFFLFIVILTGITFPQTGYVHSTNTVTCEMVDNGVIGDNTNGTYSGLTFLGGNNVIYSGGFVSALNLATGGVNAWGMCGSYDMNDFTNLIPFSGFTSNTFFDQIGSFAYDGLGVNSYIYSFTVDSQSIVYIRQIIVNPNPNPTLSGYAGIIIDFDIGPGNNYANNTGGYDPARNLIYMYDATAGTADTNYYGVMLLNVPPDSLHGLLIQNYNATTEDVANYLINNDFSTPPDTADHRLHISQYGASVPPGGQAEFQFAIVCGTSLEDLQDNADLAILYDINVPVELSSFTATTQFGKAFLNWTTASETNNLGFEIERKVISNRDTGNWLRIGFVSGNGTTTETQNYQYIDDISELLSTSLVYRLKQIDYNGTFEYSEEVTVDNPAPLDYLLEQNHPNPFNPVTIIKFSIPEKSQVELIVYTLIGEKIAELVNEEKEAGSYELEFNASDLGSGVYFYQLRAGDFKETKKMILIK